jgi:Acyclic terpene utilisation family protein AtuA
LFHAPPEEDEPMASAQENRVTRPLMVGNGAGFWGDNLDAPYLLARDGRLDVLTLEYLAELTMAILSHLRTKDPSAGYVTDLPELLERLVPILNEQPGLRIVTNAGGLNPLACAARCARILHGGDPERSLIAVVTGDDVLDCIPRWIAEGIDLSHLESGEPIGGVAGRLVAANVYLGAHSIAVGLRQGARIVLTGRVADASLTLGPAVAHFGWGWDDWSRLAGASTAGHLIECGAQATGGLWSGWAGLPDLAGIGYPIAGIAEDGSFAITKPPGTGGRVNVETVTEQLLYEIDDPSRYRTPDVDIDFTGLSIAEQRRDQVIVTGAAGRPPSDRLKLVGVYRDGWTASGMLAVVGRDAEAKARAAGEVILERVRRAGFALADTLVECFGAGDVACGVVRPASSPFEVVLRVSVRDPERAAVERFCRELAPLVTAGPPGIVGYTAGRPTPRPAFGYWPALVPRELAEPRVRLDVRTAAEWAY